MNYDDDDDFRQQPHPDSDYDLHLQIQEEERLAEDDIPFSEPDDAEDELAVMHPRLDERGDPQEIYDEGEDDAAVDSLGSTVRPKSPVILGYDPDKDERRKKAA